MTTRLILVNRVYWPNEAATAQLLQDLAEGLVREGVPVLVITARLPGTPRADTVNGVHVRRVAVGSTRRSWPSRLFHYGAFWCGSAWWVWRECGRNDVVVAMTDPPLLGLGVACAAGWRRARMWHWCQDLYPEVALVLMQTKSWQSLFRMLQSWRNRSLRRAEGVVVIAEEMAIRLRTQVGSETPLHVIENWAPNGVSAVDGRGQREVWKVERNFVIAYSGNLGRAHVIEPLLLLARALRDHAEVVFLLIGDGAQRARLEATAEREALSNVRFLPPQPRTALSEALAAADLHVITLRPGCEGTIWPSKFYGILAAERPMLFIGPPNCEVAERVTRDRLGAAFAPDEIDAMADFVRQLVDDQEARGHLRAALRRTAMVQPGLATAVRFWARVVAQPGGSVLAADRR